MELTGRPVSLGKEPAITVYDVPCDICRRRKVRCSKTQPCNNCEKGGAVCTYDENGRPSRRPPRHTELSFRLSRLETAVRNSARHTESGDRATTAKSEKVLTFRGPQSVSQNISEPAQMSHEISNPLGRKLGKLAYIDGKSRYIQSAFWAGMYEEIETLKYLLEENDEIPSASAFLFPVSLSPLASPITHLTLVQSNFMINSFIEHVDPFVRILHKKRLLFDLNHFRRGRMQDEKDFECLLFVVYALGLIPLTAEQCQQEFGLEKSALMQYLKQGIEIGLSRLHLASTHKTRNLQIFLLYITLLFWTGEMFQASGLLGLAIRTAQRLGIHRDGSNFNLSPWRIELRRRIWHHILLVDTWCIENIGTESAMLGAVSDTSFPQCSDDSSWDACEFARQGPVVSTSFTDMTGALVTYEIAAISRTVHESGLTEGDIRVCVQSNEGLVSRCRDRLDAAYFQQLNMDLVSQKIVKDLADLAFERIYFAIYPALFKHGRGAELATIELQSELFNRAIEYLNNIYRLQEEYAAHQLDWVIVRNFSWHAVTILLTYSLRKYNELTPQIIHARIILDRIFLDRLKIDYLAGPNSLWKPLQELWEDLKALEDGQSEQVPLEATGFPDDWLLDVSDSGFSSIYPLELPRE